MHIVQNALSWIVAVAGFFICALGLASFASRPILGEYEISRDGWLLISISAILGISALAGTPASFYSRRSAGWAYVSGGSLVALGGVFSESHELTIVSAIICSALILLAIFWFWTAKSQWPPFAPQGPRSRVARTLLRASMGLALFALVSIGAIKLTLMQLDIGDCGEGPPVSKPFPGQAFSSLG